ncbi:rhodanese-like domain-containing protein [Neorhodopirellula lusitana]|uniref:rhodanese-like domain-containing protein n=1 Tax=Neorhodopirellula lusitana TaxID=445327 RepID=UPI00384CA3FC
MHVVRAARLCMSDLSGADTLSRVGLVLVLHTALGKKTMMFRIAFTLGLTVVVASSHAETVSVANRQEPTVSVPANAKIQFGGFLALGKELEGFREARRIPIEVFTRMAQEPNTMILDTRSKAAYDSVHIAGAVHLNFSDFTDQKLQKVIPSKKTRVLIYCNNNFIDSVGSPTDKTQGEGVETDDQAKRVVQGMLDKRPTLALNIPTFINLYGYGYQDVYELADRLRVDDPRVKLVGQAITVNK